MARNGRSPARSAGAGAGEEPDRRRTILRAAIDVFARKGYHGCRIADVAKEAGVAYGLVYHYFQNKEELLQSVFEWSWSGFIDRVRELVKSQASAEEKIRGLVALSFEAYRADPRAVTVLILEIGRSPGLGRASRQTTFTEILALVSEIFVTGQERGEIPPDLNPVLCAALLFGAIEMGLTGFVAGMFDRKDGEALDQAGAQVARTFLRGVLATPGLETREAEWKTDRSGTKSKALKRS